MFGLDDWIAHLGQGGAITVLLAVAILLGLRHASDPDHLAVVTSLAATGRGRDARRLGLSWGLGHATTLFLFGLPIVLWRSYLPHGVQTAAEFTIGLVIIALALRLLLHHHPHRRPRSHRQAYTIGLIHGTGGSAGVGILLLSTIRSPWVAVTALVLFSLFTAVSMAILSGGFGRVISRVHFPILRYGMGSASLAFGVWYALAALSVLPYYF